MEKGSTGKFEIEFWLSYIKHVVVQLLLCPTPANHMTVAQQASCSSLSPEFVNSCP